jgi:histidinol-phosphate phosphatase family protein
MDRDDPRSARPQAVLFDRDGTLIADVPYNADPERVRVLPTVRVAVAALRRAHVPIGVISNQSGIARGLITADDVARIGRRVEHEIGRFDVWEICPHGPGEGCECRKPRPGMVVAAARRIGVSPRATAVIGDIGSDIACAEAAGARAVLVPTERTLPEEVQSAPLVAADVAEAVALLFGCGAPS